MKPSGRHRRFRVLGPSLLAASLGLLLSGCAPSSGTSAPPASQAKIAEPQKATIDHATYVRLAEAARVSRDYVQAAGFYQKALADRPDEVTLLLGLAESQFNIGAIADAYDSYRHVLRQAPGQAAAHFGLGRIALAQRKANQAEVEFRAALETEPANPRYLNEDGIALDLVGRHAAAQAAYHKGLAQASDDVALRNNLGLSLALGGAADLATEQLSALSLEPGATPRIRENLALALGLSGDDQRAAHVLRADLSEAEISNDLKYYDMVHALEDAGDSAVSGSSPPAVPTVPIAAVPLPMTSQP